MQENESEPPPEEQEPHPPPLPLIPCPIPHCTTKMSRRPNLRQHIKNVHLISNPSTVLPSPKRPIHRKPSTKPRSLKNPHHCQVPGCSVALSKKSHLYRHLRTVHQIQPDNVQVKKGHVDHDPVTIKCPVNGCDVQVSRRDALNRHLKLQHKKENCLICGWEVIHCPTESTKPMEQFIREMMHFRGLLGGKLVVCKKCTENATKVIKKKEEVMEVASKLAKRRQVKAEELARLQEKVDGFWKELRGIGEQAQNAKLKEAINSVAGRLEKFLEVLKTRFFREEVEKPVRKSVICSLGRPTPLWCDMQTVESEGANATRKSVICSTWTLPKSPEVLSPVDIVDNEANPAPEEMEASEPEMDNSDVYEENDDEESDLEQDFAKRRQLAETLYPLEFQQGDDDHGVADDFEEFEENCVSCCSSCCSECNFGEEEEEGTETGSDFLDTSSWSSIKWELYEETCRRNNYRKKLLEVQARRFLDPRLIHITKYNPTSDNFTLGHVQIVIFEATPFSSAYLLCGMCGFTTEADVHRTQGNQIKSHIQSKHLAIYQCFECAEYLGSFRRYVDHVSGHEGIFVCRDCGSSYCSEETLGAHRWDRHRILMEPIVEEMPGSGG